MSRKCVNSLNKNMMPIGEIAKLIQILMPPR